MKEILTVWKKEIRDTLRDKRTLYTAVIMPIVLMPVIMIGSLKLQESQVKSAEKQVAVVAIENQAAAPSLVNFLKTQDKISISDISNDFNTQLDTGVIQAYLAIPDNFESSITANQPATIMLYDKSTDQKSSIAAQKVQTALLVYGQTIVAQKISAVGLDPNITQIVKVQQNDIATEQERGGFFLGLLLPMFIVLFSILGGMYVAIDVSAGEKERKTLEALLLVPLSRLKIVTGKFMAVATTSITSVILSVASMYAAFKIWPPNLGETLVFSITPVTFILMILIGIILSVMFAGMLLAVAIFAKSFKEAQNYITPFYLLAILPVSIFSSIPGFKPPLGLFFVPSINAVFVFKESLMGETNWLHIIVTIATTLVGSVIAIIIATKLFSKESVLFRD
ncbi:MAG: ABC transporter permease [Patescibacteria group bacterium]|jgi:sodium transport system permease protein